MSGKERKQNTTQLKGTVNISGVTGHGDDRVHITFCAYNGKGQKVTGRDITTLVFTHEQFSLALTGTRQNIKAEILRD